MASYAKGSQWLRHPRSMEAAFLLFLPWALTAAIMTTYPIHTAPTRASQDPADMLTSHAAANN